MQQRNSALKICLPWNNSIRTLMRQLQKGESANLLTLRDVALGKNNNATTAPNSRRNLAREQRQEGGKAREGFREIGGINGKVGASSPDGGSTIDQRH